MFFYHPLVVAVELVCSVLVKFHQEEAVYYQLKSHFFLVRKLQIIIVWVVKLRSEKIWKFIFLKRYLVLKNGKQSLYLIIM